MIRAARSAARRARLRLALAALLVALLAAQPVAAETGLPVPRFVSLRSDEINVRTGPGQRYPILWVFRRKDLPVEIIAEFETWRRIRDHEGAVGWVHQSTLSGRRHVLVRGEIATLRRNAAADAPPVARAEPGVIARLLECVGAWCRVDAAGYEGWLPRADLWGVYDGETVD